MQNVRQHSFEATLNAHETISSSLLYGCAWWECNLRGYFRFFSSVLLFCFINPTPIPISGNDSSFAKTRTERMIHRLEGIILFISQPLWKRLIFIAPQFFLRFGKWCLRLFKWGTGGFKREMDRRQQLEKDDAMEFATLPRASQPVSVRLNWPFYGLCWATSNQVNCDSSRFWEWIQTSHIAQHKQPHAALPNVPILWFPKCWSNARRE